MGVVNPDGSRVTMIYIKESQLKVHQHGPSVATYTYDGDGLRRLQLVGIRVQTVDTNITLGIALAGKEKICVAFWGRSHPFLGINQNSDLPDTGA